MQGVQAVVTGALGNVQGGRIWTAEVSRGIFSRLNSAEGIEGAPAISPDGHVAFTSSSNAVGDLYWTRADGTGAPEPLLVKSPTVKHSNGFSPDGRFLIYDEHTSQREDLWVLPLEASPGGERKPIPFLVTQADETFGQFSPDGKWIAYSSDESGPREVYVQGFAPDRVPAAAGGKWKISTAGGDKPRWRRDGTELYYIARDRKLMAVPVRLGPPFAPGVAVPLFETSGGGVFPVRPEPGRALHLQYPCRDRDVRVVARHDRAELAGRAEALIDGRGRVPIPMHVPRGLCLARSTRHSAVISGREKSPTAG